MNGKTSSLLLNYSSARALIVMLNYLFNRELSEKDHYYVFGNLDLSKEEEKIFLKRHFRGFFDLLSLLVLFDNVCIPYCEFDYSLDPELYKRLGIIRQNNLRKIESSTIPQITKLARERKQYILNDYQQEIEFFNQRECCDRLLSGWFEEYISSEELLCENSLLNRRRFLNSMHSDFSLSSRCWLELTNCSKYRFYRFLDNYISSILSEIKSEKLLKYGENDYFLGDKTSISSSDISKVNNIVLSLDCASGLSIVPPISDAEDLFDWRSDREMKSYRCVFSKWLGYFRSNQFESAKKIEQDVNEAKKNIKKYNKINSLDNSPILYFAKVSLEAATGFLPGSILEGVKYFSCEKTLKQNEWVNLPAFKRHYRNIK